MNAAWTRLSSSAHYTRGKLSLREDAWRLPDGQEVVYPVLHVGATVGVLPFVGVVHAREHAHGRADVEDWIDDFLAVGQAPGVLAERELAARIARSGAEA